MRSFCDPSHRISVRNLKRLYDGAPFPWRDNFFPSYCAPNRIEIMVPTALPQGQVCDPGRSVRRTTGSRN